MIDLKILDQKCQNILKEKNVRFCGIVNNLGRQVVGRYKSGITPLVDKEEHKMCMEYALEMFMTKDLDQVLGPTEYIVSRRKKITMISIPTNDHLILISAELDADEKSIIKKAVDLLAESKLYNQEKASQVIKMKKKG